MIANARSKRVTLGFVLVDTRSGEYLSEVFGFRGPARAAASEMLASQPGRSIGVHTLEAQVPAEWKRGDSLEGYADPRDLALLGTCPECLYEQRTGRVAPVDHGCESDLAPYRRLGEHEPNEVSEGSGGGMTDEAGYAQAKARQKELEAANGAAARSLRQLSGGGAMNLTPGHVRATPEWQAAKRKAEAAFAALRAFNADFVRRYRREIQEDRRRRDREHVPNEASEGSGGGMTDEEKQYQKYKIDLGLRPDCAECGHANWVYMLRPLGWTCQRHREWFLDEHDLLPEAGHTENAGGQRRVSQFEPSAFETRGVLAGQYRGRDVAERALLTHTAWPDSDDAICGSVKSGGLADVFADPSGSLLAPTCPRCLAKDPRFSAGPRAHEPNEDQTWREVYSSGYRDAEARGLQSWQAREEASRAAWADYEARTGRKPYARNAGPQRHAVPNPPLWESDDEAEYMRLLDKYDQEMAEAMALEDAGYSPRASLHRRAAEAAEREAERISHRYAANGQSYYVWALATGSDEPLTEGPWGPYDSLDSAKTFARIGATEGAHDRAVSLGLDARGPGFQILRRYRARSGERLL